MDFPGFFLPGPTGPEVPRRLCDSPALGRCWTSGCCGTSAMADITDMVT